MPSRSHRPNSPPEPPLSRKQSNLASVVLHKAFDCGHKLGAAQLTQADKDRIVAQLNGLFVAHGTEPLYSIRKLQDWTSNQLYRWRAALKKGQKPPSPALRQHLANGPETPELAAIEEGSTPLTAAQGRAKVVGKAAGRKPRGRRAARAATTPEVVAADPEAEPSGLARHISIAADLETCELPDFEGADMDDAILCEALGAGADASARGAPGLEDQRAAARVAASLPSFSSWAISGSQKPDEDQEEDASGARTPEPPSAAQQQAAELAVSESEEILPVQDVEQIFSQDDEESGRVAASPVWEGGSSSDSGVTSPDLFSPRAGMKRDAPDFPLLEEEEIEDEDGPQEKRQAVMITEGAGSFSLVAASPRDTSSWCPPAAQKSATSLSASRPTTLTRVGSWGALNPLASNSISLGRCESSKECLTSPLARCDSYGGGSTGGSLDLPASMEEDFTSDLEEWGSTSCLARQRSWGAAGAMTEISC